MEDHIDFIIFQCLDQVILRIVSGQFKFQLLVVEAVFCKLDIIVQHTDHLTVFTVNAADTGIIFQPADPDRSVLREPFLLLA